MLTAKQIKSARDLAVHQHGPRLIAIAREIEAKASKANTYHGKAADMVISIKALLVEAKGYCDRSGFDAFRKHHCPSLGRSRAYEILSIASGRRSVQQVKTSNAARQARHVAKLKAAAAAMRRADHRPLVTDSAKPFVRSLAPTNDGYDTVRGFTARVLELVLMTATAEPKIFNAATIEADDLRKLADFLMAVANLRKPKLRVVK